MKRLLVLSVLFSLDCIDAFVPILPFAKTTTTTTRSILHSGRRVLVDSSDEALVLATLDEYIHDKDWQGLETYWQQNIHDDNDDDDNNDTTLSAQLLNKRLQALGKQGKAKQAQELLQSYINKDNENNQTTRDTYLVGNQFTAADLTWAALAYPVLQPAETASLMGYIQDGQMPPALRELRNELRVTRAGQHALQMYQRHRLTQRGNETAPRVVTLRSIGRNQWGGVRRFGTWAVGVGIVAMAARQAWDMWN